MDDLLTGSQTILESERKLQVQLANAKSAGMNSSSGQLVIHYYYQTQCVKLSDLSYSSSTETKTLDSCGSHILIPLLSRFLL
ncbi:hypothetical protein TNCV_4122251 [Trichonephila clavipes]|nr:hypothetical protein TNCV_4122251 [Trichonephila clavipes]